MRKITLSNKDKNINEVDIIRDIEESLIIKVSCKYKDAGFALQYVPTVKSYLITVWNEVIQTITSTNIYIAFPEKEKDLLSEWFVTHQKIDDNIYFFFTKVDHEEMI